MVAGFQVIMSGRFWVFTEAIGLKLQHHCIDGLLPLLVAALTMPQAETRTAFLFRMEPHRGTPALQKLPLADKGIGPAGFAFSWI